ncbi:MAG: cupredoxin domain-containing protein [Thaumarchaeota archaeon]|nr:cupredoxin domain-containing protein [Nitrososphaerota archaeon]
METEENYGPPRGMILGLGLVGLVLAAALAGVFIFKLQPQITNSVSTTAGEASVVMPSNAAVNNFAPVNITVILGVNGTVMWTNQDTIPHTVVVCPVGGGQVCSSSVAIASSSVLSHGDTFTYSFTAAGTYHYYCSIHPATMRATIVVVSQTSTTS